MEDFSSLTPTQPLELIMITHWGNEKERREKKMAVGGVVWDLKNSVWRIKRRLAARSARAVI